MTRIEKTVKDIGDLYDFYTRIKKAEGTNKRKNGITTVTTKNGQYIRREEKWQ